MKKSGNKELLHIVEEWQVKLDVFSFNLTKK